MPEAPHLRLFWATSALREFRGDGHSAVLLHAGVDGCEAHVLLASLGLVPAAQRTFRGWSDQEWQAAEMRLRERGWLDAAGGLTRQGVDARADMERATEALAAPALARIGQPGTEALAGCLAPLVERIVTSGEVPYPNGMGVPPVPELSAAR